MSFHEAARGVFVGVRFSVQGYLTRLVRQVLLLTIGLLAGGAFGNGLARADCAKTLNIVSHEDDDIIFFGAHEYDDIKAGDCVRTVYLTSGDAGGDHTYWYRREEGAADAHAYMAGVARGFTKSSVTVQNHKLAMFTLSNAPNVSMIFFRLPDGNVDGSGFASDSFQTLKKLYENTIPNIDTVPDANYDQLADLHNYTKADLVATLTQIMNDFAPTKIRMQNFRDPDTIDDHSDHLNAARFAHQAAEAYAQAHNLSVSTLVTGYRGYQIYAYEENLAPSVVATKFAEMEA